MSDYAWVITIDHLYEEAVKEGDFEYKNEAGVSGPFGATDAQIAKALSKNGRAFRIYDDDGIWYYSGKLYEEPGTEGENDFGPLDDWGTPNAGATEIRYFNSSTHRWETL